MSRTPLALAAMVALTFTLPTSAVGAPGQAPPDSPPVEFPAIEGCPDTSTSITYTVTRPNRTREVTLTRTPCEGGYVLVTRYKSPWVRL